MNADGSVVTALVLTGVTAVVRDVHDGNVPDVPRLVIGGMFVGVTLTLLAGPAPELARAIAYLILVGALFANGTALAGVVSSLTKGPVQQPTTSGPHPVYNPNAPVHRIGKRIIK